MQCLILPETEISDDEKKRIILREAKEKCQNDFWYFVRLCFPDLCTLPTPEFHRDIFELVSADISRERGNRYYAFAAPREFAKSTLVSILIPLWLIVTNRKRYIIIFSATEDNARDLISTIKYQIEYNEIILSLWGDMQGDTWQADFLTFKNGSCFRSLGIHSKFRGANYLGRRPDMCILDDVETDESVLSKDQTQFIFNVKLNKEIRYLGNAMDVVWIGTILHYESVLAQLTDPRKNTEWVKCIWRAITNNASIWPEKKTLAELLHEQAKYPAAFASEMMNDPIGDGVTPFKWEWLRSYTQLPRNLLGVAQAVDLSTGESDDFFVHVTLALDTNYNWYVVDLIRGKFDINEQIEIILRQAGQTWHGLGVEMVVLETNGYQKVMKQHVRDMMPAPCIGENSTKAKVSRIISLQPWFISGKMYYPENASWVEDFRNELIRWRQISNIQDDQLDALEMCIRRLARLYGAQSQAVTVTAAGKDQVTVHGEFVELLN